VDKAGDPQASTLSSAQTPRRLPSIPRSLRKSRNNPGSVNPPKKGSQIVQGASHGVDVTTTVFYPVQFGAESKHLGSVRSLSAS